MASLMEELMETLDAEEKLYQELIPVEQEKTRAIAGTDLEAMRRNWWTKPSIWKMFVKGLCWILPRC